MPNFDDDHQARVEAGLTPQDANLVMHSLLDERDSNPAIDKLLDRPGRDERYWVSLYLMFTGLAAEGIEIDGPNEFFCLDCVLHDYCARKLLPQAADNELLWAQTRVARRAAHFAEDPHPCEEEIMARDAILLVRAAYALARDLSLPRRHPELYVVE